MQFIQNSGGNFKASRVNFIALPNDKDRMTGRSVEANRSLMTGGQI
jgi:hypothetical protein